MTILLKAQHKKNVINHGCSGLRTQMTTAPAFLRFEVSLNSNSTIIYIFPLAHRTLQQTKLKKGISTAMDMFPAAVDH